MQINFEMLNSVVKKKKAQKNLLSEATEAKQVKLQTVKRPKANRLLIT